MTGRRGPLAGFTLLEPASPWLAPLLAMAFAMPAAAGDAAVVVAHHDDLGDGLGWPGYRIGNGVATAAVAPELGGRLVSYRIGEREFCWTDPAWRGRRLAPALGGDSYWQYAAYGGARFLLAPQSQWKAAGAPISGWPPAPALDRAAYAAIPTARGVECHGPAEDNPMWTCDGMALRYAWELAPGSSRLAVDAVLSNYSQHRQAWGLWSIVQALVDEPRSGPAAAAVIWPKRRQGRSRFGAAEVMDQSGSGLDGSVVAGDGVIRVPDGPPRKLSGDSDGGWIAIHRPAIGMALAVRFPYEEEAWGRMAYPEGGSTVATAVLAPAPVIELENMGPVRDILPGASIAIHQVIAACAIAAAPRRVEEWGMVAGEPAIADGHLRASLGVFAVGEIRLSIAGRPVESLAVSPLRPVVVDREIGAGSVELVLVPAGGAAVPLLRRAE